MKGRYEILDRIKYLEKEAARTAVIHTPIFEMVQISELKWVLDD